MYLSDLFPARNFCLDDILTWKQGNNLFLPKKCVLDLGVGSPLRVVAAGTQSEGPVLFQMAALRDADTSKRVCW